jgi:hypothetical protein
MTVGMVLDYVEEFIEQSKPEKEKAATARRATQEDFDAF